MELFSKSIFFEMKKYFLISSVLGQVVSLKTPNPEGFDQTPPRDRSIKYIWPDFDDLS